MIKTYFVKNKEVRVPGFEPGSKPWQGFVIPGYTTPALYPIAGGDISFDI